jgi:hypothetical protein
VMQQRSTGIPFSLGYGRIIGLALLCYGAFSPQFSWTSMLLFLRSSPRVVVGLLVSAPCCALTSELLCKAVLLIPCQGNGRASRQAITRSTYLLGSKTCIHLCAFECDISMRAVAYRCCSVSPRSVVVPPCPRCVYVCMASCLSVSYSKYYRWRARCPDTAQCVVVLYHESSSGSTRQS